MEREALKLALEALSDLLDQTETPPDTNCSCHIAPPCHDCVEYSGIRYAIKQARTTIALMKEALAQPAREQVAWGIDWGHNGDRSCASIIKKHQDGTIEVVATEYDPKTSCPSAKPAHSEWNAALDEAATRIGEIKGFGQATQDSFAVYIKGLKR
jgi:hypothetical protein